MRATVDRSGRLVLPKALREQVGIQPGEVEVTADGVALRVELVGYADLVEVDGVEVRVKSGPYGAKPEHDDVAALAARLGLPLRAAADRVLAAHRATRPDPTLEAGHDR